MRTKIAGWLLLVVFLLVAPWAAAQTGKGVITGRVTDPSGAVVPAAKITVIDAATGVRIETQTNGDGYFEAPPLIPSTYEVQVQAKGFKTLDRKGITVQVEDRIALELKLEIGQASETVTITAEGPQMRTEDAQAGEVITDEMLATLPSNNNVNGFLRDPLLLLTLSGDVQGTNGARAGYNLGPYASGGGGKYSGIPDTRINGGRTGNIEYLVDGVSVTMNAGHTVSNATPSYDDVAEFKVVTNGIDAEYGRLSGGAVSLTTKSGSSAFHGQAFEYYQGAAINANSWSNDAEGAAKGNFHFNTFGGALGGPIWIPKVYNGKQKTFFFANYEGVRQSFAGNQNLSNVPTTAERGGDLSADGNAFYDPTNSANQTPYAQIYDPFGPNSYPTINPLPANPSPWLSTPYYERLQLISPNSANPGQIIPTNYLDPTIQAYLKFIPMPNHTALFPYTDTDNFAYRSPETKTNDSWSVRLDHNINSKQNIFFRFNHEYFKDFSAGAYNSSPGGWQSTNLNGYIPGGFGTSLGYNYAFSPTLLLEVRVGGNYSPYSNGTSLPANFSNSSFHFPADIMAALGGDTNNVVGINAMESESNNFPGGGDNYKIQGKGGITYNSTNFQFAATLTKILGRHAVKFGYEGRRYYDNFTDQASTQMDFDAEGTGQFVETSTQANSPNWSNQGNANALGSFLMGMDSWMTIQSPFIRHYREDYYAAFVQDDFKVTPKLTLNLGLRWETETPLTEKNNQLQIWNANAPSVFTINPGYNFNSALVSAGLDPSQVQVPSWVLNDGFPKGAFQLAGTPGHPSNGATNWHPLNFAPRLGAAYAVNPLTTLRGSFAILYAPTSGDLSAYGDNVGPAYSALSNNSNQQSAGCNSTNLNTGNVGVYGHGLQTLSGVTPSGLTPGYSTDPFQCPASQILPRTTDNLSLNYLSAGQYGAGTGGLAETMHMPQEFDWSFGIQRQLPWKTLLELQYLGNHSSSLLAKTNPSRFPANLYNGGPTGQNYQIYNTNVASPFASQGPNTGAQVPLAFLEYLYPYFGYNQVSGVNAGTSNFNALNLRVQKRFSDGLQVLFNYTHSKLLDDVGGSDLSAGQGGPAQGNGTGGRAPQSVLYFTDTYGLDPTDQADRINVVYSYQLPFGRGRRYMSTPSGAGGTLLDYTIGGWEVSGNTSWRSGTPIVFSYSQSPDFGIGVYALNASLAPGATLSDVASGLTGRSVLWPSGSSTPPSSTSAFTSSIVKPANFTLGTIPYTYANLRNPSIFTTDLSLMKNFPVFSKDGSRYIQLRAEALNVFNHPVLGNYDGNMSDATFGYITGMNGSFPERHVQIAAKFVF
jgi:hypothetical protein